MWQVLIAVPAGLWLGHWLVRGLIAMHDTEMFQIPAVIQPRSDAIAGAVVLLSAAASAVLVHRKIGQLDLVAVLKARE
jgi:putative ABC transport system permease protein